MLNSKLVWMTTLLGVFVGGTAGALTLSTPGLIGPQKALGNGAINLAQVEGAAQLANDPQVTSKQQAAIPDDGTKKMRRVLLTRRGMSLRGLTQLVDERWHISNKGKEQQMPAYQIVSFAAEKGLLKEWKKRRKANPQSAATVEWCMEVGLLSEGLAQLDRAIEAHAERDQALALLEEFQRFLPAPPKYVDGSNPKTHLDTLWAWLKGRQTITMELLAAQAWASAAREHHTSTPPEIKEPWLATLSEACRSKNAKYRQFVLSSLRQWREERSGPDLRRFAMLDRTETVRLHAGWLIGTLDQSTQLGEILGFLEHGNSDVRLRATQAVGQAGYAAAVPALVASLQGGGSSPRRVPHAHIFIGNQTAYVQDFSPEIAAGSSIADPEVNVLVSGAVLDAGVISVTIERTIIATQRSLKRITGHRPGGNAKAWTKWLESYPSVEAEWRSPWPTPESVALLQTEAQEVEPGSLPAPPIAD